ncbi:MAG: hypothetical protein ACLSUV_01580 [Bacilli bacterium]
MSTRSYICIENEDKSISGIYCHSDGYLTYNGAMLLDHYSDREKVKELISLGDLSILLPNLHPNKSKPHSFDYNERQDDVCVFYGRDRGEKDTNAREVDLEKLDKNIFIEYVYVFGLDNKWRYFEGGSYKETGLMEVDESLNIEYKKLGFERPKNVYGFYTDKEIEHYKSLQKQKDAEM